MAMMTQRKKESDVKLLPQTAVKRAKRANNSGTANRRVDRANLTADEAAKIRWKVLKRMKTSKQLVPLKSSS